MGLSDRGYMKDKDDRYVTPVYKRVTHHSVNVSSGKIIFGLAVVCGAFAGWKAQQPNFIDIAFGKPSLTTSIIIGVIAFFVALVILNVARKILRWVFSFLR